ncbi:hypothetical protein VUR80DRAFT_5550 [Thermomyces stellatus]
MTKDRPRAPSLVPHTDRRHIKLHTLHKRELTNLTEFPATGILPHVRNLIGALEAFNYAARLGLGTWDLQVPAESGRPSPLMTSLLNERMVDIS